MREFRALDRERNVVPNVRVLVQQIVNVGIFFVGSINFHTGGIVARG
jgi:hypothetical protein